MPWQAERTWVNQKVQVGAESTSALGTIVSAGKLLQCFDFVFQIDTDVMFFTPTGHKYPSTQEENTEWVSGTLGGNFDYNGIIYPLGGVMGATTVTAHGSSSVAKDWVFTPPTTGSIVPQTYTFEQGDSVRAHRFGYGLFTEWGYKGTRKDFSTSGKLIGQAITDGITLTSTPSSIAVAPVVAKQVNVYIDATQSALGTTQIQRPLGIDYSMGNVYGPLWVLNRANISWTAHVDLAPKSILKLKLEANSEGMALLGYLQNGNTYYVRVNAQGVVIDNNQTITLGTQSSGNFTLTYKGQTTGNIAYNAAASAVQTALQALSTIGSGNATVAGSTGGPYTVTFANTLATDTTALTGTFSGLTTPSNAAITQTQIYNTFTHDMAVKFGKPTAFSDDQGIFAIEWEATIVEDATWGKSQVVTVTNLITAL